MRAPGPHRGPVHDRPSVSLFFNSRTRNWSDDVVFYSSQRRSRHGGSEHQAKEQPVPRAMHRRLPPR